MSGVVSRARLMPVAAARAPHIIKAAAVTAGKLKSTALPKQLLPNESGEKDTTMLTTADSSQIKDFHCQNKQCRAVLCQTDGVKIYAETPEKQSALLSHRKKRLNLLYCPKCHRYSRWRRVGSGVSRER